MMASKKVKICERLTIADARVGELYLTPIGYKISPQILQQPFPLSVTTQVIS